MIILKRLLQDKGAVIALGIIVLYVFLGLVVPLVTFYDPNHILIQQTNLLASVFNIY